MNFEQKYLKYKTKYLNLKNQLFGGDPPPPPPIRIPGSEAEAQRNAARRAAEQAAERAAAAAAAAAGR
jgi:hypothetical protein